MYWVHHCRPGTVLTWFPSSWSTGSFCSALLSNASDSSEWEAMDLFALTVHQLTEGTILATGGAALCTSLVPTESQGSIRLKHTVGGVMGRGDYQASVYGFVRHVTYTEQITFVLYCSNNFMYNIMNNRRKPSWCTSLASVLACVILCVCQPRSINSSKVASNVRDMPSHASEESKWYQLVDLWEFDINQE